MLRTGREEAANMVPEPECRNVAIPGLRPSQRKERQKHHEIATPGRHLLLKEKALEIATPVCTGSQ